MEEIQREAGAVKPRGSDSGEHLSGPRIGFWDGWTGERVPPIPLDQGTVIRWPGQALPEQLRSYVEAVSASVQIPPDIPGMLALGVLSTCWAGKVCAAPWPGYTEQLCLYCVAAIDVGERKTATYAKFIEPIDAHQRELRAEREPLQSNYRADRARLESRLRRMLEGRSSQQDPKEGAQDSAEAVRAIQRELDQLRPPLSAEFVTQDCTPEGLARLMADTGGFACMLSSEGGGVFDILGGRYSDSPNLDLYLKGYDGEQFIVHRASRERSFPPIERPSLVLMVTTQPQTLRQLAKSSALADRGLIARMLFSVPSESRVGFRVPQGPAIPERIGTAYKDAIGRMLRVSRPDVPHEIGFSAEACAALHAHFARIEERLKPSGDLHAHRGWGCKLTGKIVRIATLFHLFGCRDHAEPWRIPVSVEAFDQAAQLADYFIAHAVKALALVSEPPHIERARKLLAYIQRERVPQFTGRTAHRVIAHNGTSDAVRPVLELLADHHYIVRLEASRRDSEVWRVNPYLFQPECGPVPK